MLGREVCALNHNVRLRDMARTHPHSRGTHQFNEVRLLKEGAQCHSRERHVAVRGRRGAPGSRVVTHSHCKNTSHRSRGAIRLALMLLIPAVAMHESASAQLSGFLLRGSRRLCVAVPAPRAPLCDARKLWRGGPGPAVAAGGWQGESAGDTRRAAAGAGQTAGRRAGALTAQHSAQEANCRREPRRRFPLWSALPRRRV